MDWDNWLRVGVHVMVHGLNDDYVGEVEAILPNGYIALKTAYWVAESGRLNEFVRNGRAQGMELEYVGRKILSCGDVTYWPHPLDFGDAV